MNSLFVEEDFQKMKFNVYALGKKKDILKALPALRRYESFVNYSHPEDKDKDRLIKYVLLMYDMKSPYIGLYADLQERKEAVATSLGFTIDSDRVDEIFNLEDEGMLAMILEFMRDQNWMKWQLLCSCEQTFYEYQEVILNPVKNYKTDKDRLGAVQLKSQMMTDCDSIIERIDKYYQDIFGDGEIVEKATGRTSSPESMVR